MLFKRGPLLGPRLILLVIFSILLMIWDHRHHQWVDQTRSNLSLVTAPLTYAVNAPFAFFDAVADHLQSRQSLIDENTSLRARELILQGQLQKLQSLQVENTQLKALLKSSPVANHLHLLLAEILAVNTGPFKQEILLDKGSQDGVFIGQAVLDAEGIMGQIIEVDALSSRVLLLTDPRSGIPITDERNGLHGILVGLGDSGNLSWLDASPTADIKVGDVLMSSGLGGHYPVGYPVGVVSSIEQHTADQFLRVIITPSAQINSSEHVLLVLPDAKGKTS